MVHMRKEESAYNIKISNMWHNAHKQKHQQQKTLNFK